MNRIDRGFDHQELTLNSLSAELEESVAIVKSSFISSNAPLIEYLTVSWRKFPKNQAFTNPSHQRYRNSEEKISSYSSLEEAFDDFGWQGRSFSESTEELLIYRKHILRSLSHSNSGELFADLCEVLKWGGVLYNNIVGPLLDKHREQRLVDYIRWVIEHHPFDASSADTSAIESFPEDTLGELLSDSGMTKIYSVISDECIIYDDRVAACLGRIITWFQGSLVLPEELKLVVSSQPKRNPTSDRHKFISKASKKATKSAHAVSNLKANWLVESTVKRLMSHDANFKARLREEQNKLPHAATLWLGMRMYEAAMFMAGNNIKADHS